ncbi:hypothetical protein UFOVP117_272 [uncultured Caudovirales phage]|uniref:Uncharacterized protein n=1 Tax=uncultured Caudovirales phage TaxID=2100421 RepID=A0A6J5L6W4_9CAUD|nr:hypothetical protein UFOVP117_272 [uncultured Caudovirales phage]
MEPEEDNIGVLQTRVGYDMSAVVDNINNYYAINNGGLTVNPYFENDYQTRNRTYNEDGKFIFPELLFKVLKKSLPGISSIVINKFETKFIFSASDFEPTPSYLIYVDVKYNWDTSEILSPDKLADKINMSFPMIYTDVKFVTFQVNTVKVERRNYEKEFMNIFGKK